jgi:hypothetical protein
MSRMLHLEKYYFGSPLQGEIHENIKNIIGSYLQIGYQLNNNSVCYSNDTVYICLQLKVENKVLDEIALIFNKNQDYTFTGSLSTRQMNWAVENQKSLDELSKKHNVSMHDLLIPKDNIRWQENGKSLYSTEFGYFMYTMVYEKDTISVDCSVLNENKNIVFNNTTKSLFYPWGNKVLLAN